MIMSNLGGKDPEAAVSEDDRESALSHGFYPQRELTEAEKNEQAAAEKAAADAKVAAAGKAAADAAAAQQKPTPRKK